MVIYKEKICNIGKKWVGPQNFQEKMCNIGKHLWVGTKSGFANFFMMCSANIFLTPPCLIGIFLVKIRDQNDTVNSNKIKDVHSGRTIEDPFQ